MSRVRPADRQHAGQVAGRAIILDMGQLAFDGTAQEVLDNEDLHHEYLAI